jgi:lysophospholipase L1-like esterase
MIPMHLLPRRAPALLVTALLAAGATRPLAAQEIVARAFGDSITDGFGDTTTFHGYPARLERWLRQQGYDALVTKHGVGGETTAQGLSRIDSVLALGGGFLLLMEGTNDISKHVGIESMRFNLDQMATRAEDLGMIAIHASVIPRVPTAPVDSSNTRTAALAEAVLELGQEHFRAVADVFHVFEGLPNLFENYYYFDPDQDPPDPVGHPNAAGYNQIAGTFLEAMLPLLDGAQVQIVPPGTSGPTGALLSFQVVASPEIVRVEWDFGDGGFDVRELPQSLDTFYIFSEAGTFHVSVRGTTSTGGVATDSVAFHAQGAPLDWPSRFLLFEAAESSTSGFVATDLALHNDGFDGFALAEATFLPDIRYDQVLPVRRFLVPPGSDVKIADVVGSGFGAPGGRGGLIVELRASPAPSELTAAVHLRSASDPGGDDGCSLAGTPPAQWSAAPRSLAGISLLTGESATFHVTNLDGVAGTVRMDVYDAASAYIGSALFDLAAGGSRQRELVDLFRGLVSRPAPFRANFASSGIRYSAAVVGAGHGEEVRCAIAVP